MKRSCQKRTIPKMFNAFSIDTHFAYHFYVVNYNICRVSKIVQILKRLISFFSMNSNNQMVPNCYVGTFLSCAGNQIVAAVVTQVLTLFA